METREEVVLYVNGERHAIGAAEAWPTRTLLDWLRFKGLTGTKLGCGEGGCGACTVLVSALDRASGEVGHLAVNGCMMPVLAADGTSITTVEGLGSVSTGLHPVQDRMVRYHGSQCGFCTPGIVMAIAGIFANKPDSTVAEVEEHLDGNLCRCTGYRPIWDAAKTLCSDAADIEDCAGSAEAKHGACAGKGGGSCGGVCVKRSTTSDKCKDESPFDGAAPAFPEELMAAEPLPALHFTASDGRGEWVRPASLAQLLQLLDAKPDSRLVVGNTEVGIETKFKGTPLPLAVSTSGVAELYTSSITDKEMRFGACLALSRVQHLCEVHKESSPVAAAIFNMLRWFASTQIRNVACLGGNLATASPISDMNPLLAALGATLILESAKSGTREVLVRDFFLAYRKVDLNPGEIIREVVIPQCDRFEYVFPFKQARRREDDISIVTSGMKVCLEPSESGDAWKVRDCSLAYGGMAPTTITAHKACAALVGQPWTRETIEAAQAAVLAEMDLPEDVPGGQAQYRRTLAASFLFKLFVQVCGALEADVAAAAAASSSPALPAVPAISDAEKSAAVTFVTQPKPAIRGAQQYPDRTQPGVGCETELEGPSLVDLPPPAGEKASAAGVARTHASGPQHTTGEAIYIDDMPDRHDTVHGALVMSKRAGRGVKLGKVDPSAALAMPGVHGYFGAEDIAKLGGSNELGAVIHDEEVFATSELRQVGQVIGVICADTHEQAVAAARAVDVEYIGEQDDAVVSIDEAIAAGSFFDVQHEVAFGGDLSKVLAEAAAAEDTVVVEGHVKVGGQEHFYLETNSCLVVPSEGGEEMEVFASTQGTAHTQQDCATATGLPAHKVVAKTKRMGGGFGGKETRTMFVSAAAAVAARRLLRPVKLTLERDMDMSTTGQRHAFLVRYKAAARFNAETGSPELVALDAQLFSNGGCSLDLSVPVLDRAMLHLDGCYHWPNFRAVGRVCRTAQPPHTAFRGFGGPQGILVGEAIMEHLASDLQRQRAFAPGLSVVAAAEQLRAAAFYKEGQSTHFGTVMRPGSFYVPRAWAELEKTAQVAERRAACADFNSKNRWRKRGIAMLPTKFGINFTAKFMNIGQALVHLYTDGTVLVSHGGTEMGQGLHTKVAQVAAHAFNVPLSQVHVGSTDTDKVANSNPTAASLSTDLYGMATLDACKQILARIQPVRKEIEASTGKRASLKDVAKAAYFQRVDLSAHGCYKIPDDACGYNWDLPVDADRGKPFNYFTQGVACSEVEIDVLTGDHRVLRTDILMDLGISINPAIDIGQIEGAFVQGMGWCTTEELIWGDSDHPWVRPAARLFTAGPGTYKIPAFNDTPEVFNVTLMSDVENEVAVHSSKAVGEPPFFLGASVLFAIKDALYAARQEVSSEAGTQYFQLNAPCTSERVRMACMDPIAAATIKGDPATFQPRGSW